MHICIQMKLYYRHCLQTFTNTSTTIYLLKSIGMHTYDFQERPKLVIRPLLTAIHGYLGMLQFVFQVEET